ncbi:hypothetical protein ACIBI8_00425 [Streptomyces sp. NPDC050529]|uniref:hypothetical protein n=1 Tax=Streptomyces sp. NPDC050529 TaxID=3365624 RepID=UPI0037B3B857
MSLQKAQMALFKAYMDPGYRLAHRLNAQEFSDHFGIHGEYALTIKALSPDELDDFANSLHGKRSVLIKAALPRTYEWIEKNNPHIIYEYLDVYRPTRSQDREDIAAYFVPYLNEYLTFWGNTPTVLPAVARLEFALLLARNSESAKNVDQGSAKKDFTWNSLFWMRRNASLLRFAVDPLPALLGKAEMTAPGKPASIIVTPAPSSSVPIVLRLAAVAATALEELSEPITAQELMRRCREQNIGISEDSLKNTLSALCENEALGHHYIPDIHE